MWVRQKQAAPNHSVYRPVHRPKLNFFNRREQIRLIGRAGSTTRPTSRAHCDRRISFFKATATRNLRDLPLRECPRTPNGEFVRCLLAGVPHNLVC
jgi:hypothetical protein